MRVVLFVLLSLVVCESALAERQRLLVMDLATSKGIAKDTAQTFTDFLTAYLSESTRLLVVSKRDIARIADLEADKQQQGCDNSDACMAEIGGALGARFVVFGRMSQLGSATFVHLTLVDTASGQPLARKVVSHEDLGQLANAMRDACVELGQVAAGSRVGLGVGGPVPSTGRARAPSAPEPVVVETKPRVDTAKPATRAVSSADASDGRGSRLIVASDDDDDADLLERVPRESDDSSAMRVVQRKERAAQMHADAEAKRAFGIGTMIAGTLLGGGLLIGGITSTQQTLAVGGAIGCCALGSVSLLVGGLQVIDAGEMDKSAELLENPTGETKKPQRY